MASPVTARIKASAQPMAWEPIFAIAPGARFTPMTLRSLAGAFSGGSPERFVARAVVSGAARELDRLWERVRPA